MTAIPKKQDIRQMRYPALAEALTGMGFQSFRARQVWEWLWKKGAHSLTEMTNLSLRDRALLSERFDILPIREDKVQRSVDGTVKFRFRLHDGHLIESVLIPAPADRRYTVCVSCQVGCSLSCRFCATGQMKRVRNLEAAEIVDQVVLVNRQCMEIFGFGLTNIVYMGMGEPLLAYRPVLESIERITASDGLAMSPSRITVSTAGIAKMIVRLADEGVRFNLALSLHAPTDAQRDTIMPINEENNLPVLMDALHYFYQRTRNRISFEYIAFRDFNDREEDAVHLAKLCRRFPVRVNIIEYNAVPGLDFHSAGEDRIDRFAAYLSRRDIVVTVRRSRGKDIDAACGQLANR
ncbi:MAG: hypothetical protein RLY31_2007 [Bacteroidota bacterium]|jgi:23S rRNA (adenine2503-C2)-methyltransferase